MFDRYLLQQTSLVQGPNHSFGVAVQRKQLPSKTSLSKVPIKCKQKEHFTIIVFWEMEFWENVILGEWDNWACIKSRALGVKVDRRSQSQPAGLEQGARERTEVLV